MLMQVGEKGILAKTFIPGHCFPRPTDHSFQPHLPGIPIQIYLLSELPCQIVGTFWAVPLLIMWEAPTYCLNPLS